MAFAATLFQEARTAERHATDLDGALRGPERLPLDVTITDLSAEGFRAVGTLAIAAGTCISIGLPSLGIRGALVMRAEDGQFGCRFTERLSREEMARLLSGVVTAPIPFPAYQRADLLLETALPPIRRYPARIRAALLAGAVSVTWGLMLFIRHAAG